MTNKTPSLSVSMPSKAGKPVRGRETAEEADADVPPAPSEGKKQRESGAGHYLRLGSLSCDIGRQLQSSRAPVKVPGWALGIGV